MNTNNGVKIHGNFNVVYNKAIRKILESIAKNWHVRDIKSFEQLGKIQNELTKIRDILQDKKVFDLLKDFFDTIRKMSNLE